jgi:hypothetical protein
MLSQGPTPHISALSTPLTHYGALVDFTSVTPITSLETVVSITSTTYPAKSPHMGIHSHSIEHAPQLLSFIHQTRAAMRPPEIGRPRTVPLEPD